ncbi:DUF5590 domain-containing protein [Listeria ilorinensis]|uniref:cell wall elongation regulator TseB-like domain-containing protein n=1 Tax=Listeria ilorinensis TaxID=2867439 RepID=UPI001EF6FC37|nr:DUF5590 domain-containing protein [Listeria ilorinensis]
MSGFILQRRKNKKRIGLWILLALGILILISGGAYLYLRSAEKPVEEAKQEALDRISGSIELKEQDQFYLYNGVKSTYYVLTGKNKENKDIVVWVPEKKSGKIYVKYASDGISEAKAKQIVEEKKHPKKILNVTLGMENGVPLYEVSYIGKNDSLNYYDMTFSDGEWLREIENL